MCYIVVVLENMMLKYIQAAADLIYPPFLD